MDSTLTQLPEVRSTEGKLAARAELIRRFSDTDVLTGLIQKAVHEAVLEHKRIGNPIASSVNGKVVIFQPEDIEVPEG